MLSIKKDMEGIVRRKGRVNGGKSEGVMNHERLDSEQQTEGFGGEVVGSWGEPGGGY